MRGRTAWLALGLLGVLAAGAWAALRWPPSRSPLDCPPAQVRWVQTPSGPVATCEPVAAPAPPPAGQALTVGQKLDLNAATAEDLGLVPGIGPRLAEAIVGERQRLGGFSSWDQLEDVRGIGPAKLQALMQATELTP